MSGCDTVLRPLIGQHRQLVRPRQAVVAGRRGLGSRRLGLVLYEKRKLDDGPQVVVAVDAGFVELTVQIVLETADYDMRIHGEDRYERRVRVRAAVTSK